MSQDFANASTYIKTTLSQHFKLKAYLTHVGVRHLHDTNMCGYIQLFYFLKINSGYVSVSMVHYLKIYGNRTKHTHKL